MRAGVAGIKLRPGTRRLDVIASNRHLPGRAVGLCLAAAHLMITTAVLSTVVLSLAPHGPAGGVIRDGSPLYQIAIIGLWAAAIGTGSRYLHYYRCWLSTRHDFANSPPFDALQLEGRALPYLKFQVTTKGGALPVVERSLIQLDVFCRTYPALASRISVEVISDLADEATTLTDHFRESAFALTAVTLPADYVTPNRTQYKARALHYLVDQRRRGFNAKPGPTYIVHLDEETLITNGQLLILIGYLSNTPRPISQGPIYYPLEWARTPWLCRTMECVRPFGCSECATVMRNPPPHHLHGSNLVVEESVENAIGWDFGTIEGRPFIAEDLVFGLKAYAELGAAAFGWHGAAMLEQPPLSPYWAFRQRRRWVEGALQALGAMWHRPEFSAIPRPARIRLHAGIAYRIATYALGFPFGLTGLAFALPSLTRVLHGEWTAGFQDPLRLAMLVVGLAWVGSYQIGLARNLRDQPLPLWERLRQSLIVLALTPVAGLVETIGPFTAVVESSFGMSKGAWVPTPKMATNGTG